MWWRTTTLIFVLGVCGLSSTVAIAQVSENVPAQDYETLRTLAQKQAQDPVVARYRARVAATLDAAVNTALMHCVRREYYSRRAESGMILAVAADGTISAAVVETENRMGRCAATALGNVKLPAPPEAPLYIQLGAHFEKP